MAYSAVRRPAAKERTVRQFLGLCAEHPRTSILLGFLTLASLTWGSGAQNLCPESVYGSEYCGKCHTADSEFECVADPTCAIFFTVDIYPGYDPAAVDYYVNEVISCSCEADIGEIVTCPHTMLMPDAPSTTGCYFFYPPEYTQTAYCFDDNTVKYHQVKNATPFTCGCPFGATLKIWQESLASNQERPVLINNTINVAPYDLYPSCNSTAGAIECRGIFLQKFDSTTDGTCDCGGAWGSSLPAQRVLACSYLATQLPDSICPIEGGYGSYYLGGEPQPSQPTSAPSQGQPATSRPSEDPVTAPLYPIAQPAPTATQPPSGPPFTSSPGPLKGSPATSHSGVSMRTAASIIITLLVTAHALVE